MKTRLIGLAVLLAVITGAAFYAFSVEPGKRRRSPDMWGERRLACWRTRRSSG